MAPKNRGFSPIILLLSLSLSFAAGCSKGERDPGPEVTVQAVAARKADISRVVSAEAILFPIAQSAITPKINAPVKKFFVVRGQKVKQGQLLAELENRDLSATAMDNKGAFQQAEAQYETSVGATLPEETQKAELAVQTAQQELDAQEKLYTSREDLYKQGALPRKELDAAGVSLAQARSAYNIAKKHLDALNAVGKQDALKSAGGQLTSARGKMLASEAQLSYSEIRSPISGVVTDRPLYPGEMASASMPLLTVMDVSQVIAKAHVPETDAVLLRKGDKASLTIPGLDQSISGTVTLVSPALDPNSTTLEVWVQAANPNQQLRPGMTAQLTIIAETVHDALVVPPSALLNANGAQGQVMVVNSRNEAKSRDVRIGIQTPEEVQIVSGLKPGEQVISQGAYGLPDKTRVKIEKPDTAEKMEGHGAGEKSDKD